MGDHILNWAMVAWGGTLNDHAGDKFDDKRWYVIQLRESGPHNAYPLFKFDTKSEAVDRFKRLLDENNEYAGGTITDKWMMKESNVILTQRGKNALERQAWDRGGIIDPL